MISSGSGSRHLSPTINHFDPFMSHCVRAQYLHIAQRCQVLFSKKSPPGFSQVPQALYSDISLIGSVDSEAHRSIDDKAPLTLTAACDSVHAPFCRHGSGSRGRIALCGSECRVQQEFAYPFRRSDARARRAKMGFSHRVIAAVSPHD